MSPAGVASAASPTPPSDPQADWWSEARRDLRLAEYQVTRQESTVPGLPAAYQAPNRASGFRTYFAESGLHLIQRGAPPKLGMRRLAGPLTAEPAESGAWGLGIALVGVSDGQAMVDLAQPRLAAAGNRIEYQRGAVTEWYQNDEEGLEQGFTVYGPPGGSGTAAAPIAIDLAFTGNLTPSMARGSDAIDLVDGAGRRVLRYLGLRVYDATGARVPAHMELPPSEQATGNPSSAAGRTLVRRAVDATGAHYPIIGDPTISGLSPAPDWSVTGEQDAASFGFSVAPAGDINGDGYSDVIVGAPWYDNLVFEDNSGRVFVYLGSTSGISTTVAWTAYCTQTMALFGSAVGTAGDVNYDGYDDIIVGASDYDDSYMDEGAVFVWFGPITGLSPTGAPDNANWKAFGGQVSAYFGTSVGTAGKVNDDRYADIIVGAVDFSNGQSREGRAYVYYGPDLTSSWTAEGDQADASFGASVGSAGDVNNDGYAVESRNVVPGAL